MGGVSDPSPGTGTALDDPRTSQRLAATRRGATGLLIGGLLAALLGVVGLRATAAADDRQRATLEPVTGTVAAIIPAGLLDTGSLVVRVGDRTAEVTADLERETWAAGDEVALLVDPADPDVVRRVDLAAPSGSPLLVALTLTGVAAAAAGTVGLRRVLRWQRVLAGHPWRRTPYHARTSEGRFLRVELVTEDGTRLRVEPTPRWLVAPFLAPGRATLWVAGTGDGPQVAALPRARAMVGVRRID